MIERQRERERKLGGRITWNNDLSSGESNEEQTNCWWKDGKYRSAGPLDAAQKRFFHSSALRVKNYHMMCMCLRTTISILVCVCVCLPLCVYACLLVCILFLVCVLCMCVSVCMCVFVCIVLRVRKNMLFNIMVVRVALHQKTQTTNKGENLRGATAPPKPLPPITAHTSVDRKTKGKREFKQN